MEINKLVRGIFYWLSAMLGVFIVMEIIWPNIILAYFNLNWLVLGVLVFGLASLIKK